MSRRFRFLRETLSKEFPTEEWDSGIIAHDHCPHLVKKVYLTQKVWGQIKFLQEQVDMEFFLYLLGEKSGEAVLVQDIYIPEQEASYAGVEVVEKAPEGVMKRVVGTLHKHPGGIEPIPSETDRKHRNHLVNLIIASTGDAMNCTIHQKVPCGAMITSNCEVIISQEKVVVSSDELAKIRKKSYIPPYTPSIFNY